MLTVKDFGKIALIVNEFGNLKKGEVQVYANGELVIQYGLACQSLEPCELNNLLLVKRNEYEEEMALLVDSREPEDSSSWRERNLRSYIEYLKGVSYKLNELHTFQQEQALLEKSEK